mgnify:CR=1 FL=1
MYEKSTLANGLRLVTHKMPQRNSAALGIWLGVGGRYEKKANKGVAHLMEHLCFKGTRRYSANEIKQTIEGLGGSLNGFTSEEFTCYLTKIISSHLLLALDILSDMVLEPLLADDDLKKEKSVIIEEIKMYRDLPQAYVNELLDELLWPGHPLGMNLAGTPESVNRLKQSQLVDFKHQFYHPANIVVSVCGNIEHEKLCDKLSLLFAKAKSRANTNSKKVNIKQAKPRSRFLYKDTQQSHMSMGYHAVSRQHPDRHVVSLLHIILGANMSSRLFSEIRDKKGLAYEIGTSPRYFNDTGAFFIHAGVDNRKVRTAISAIGKEIHKITVSPVAKKELMRAKEYYTGQLLMSLEDTLDHMLWMGEQETALRRVRTTDEILKEINKVAIDDLLRVAKGIFRSSSLSLAIIGPQKEKEQAKIASLL